MDSNVSNTRTVSTALTASTNNHTTRERTSRNTGVDRYGLRNGSEPLSRAWSSD